MNRRSEGARFERLAAEYLETCGCKILRRNYLCKRGEIDLIVQDGRYLVFVEVKYLRDGRAGDPLEAVDTSKQRRISRAAAWFLLEEYQSLDLPCRFDVVGIRAGQVHWIQNAFSYKA
ncbi:MAG: YraN family protein [Blautia sp.]